MSEHRVSNVHSVAWTDEKIRFFWQFYSARPDVPWYSELAGSELIVKYWPQIARSNRILDYGCGSGAFIERLLETGRSIAGYDSSDATAAISARFSSKQNFIGVIGQDRISDFHNTFDLVFMIEVIEHLQDGGLETALSTVKSLLRPGGQFIVTTPNDENLNEGIVCCPDCGAVFHRWQHMRSWNSDSLSKTLSEHGFRVEEVGPFHISVYKRDRWKLLRPSILRLIRRRPLSLGAIATRI
jgi:2-polyprenyl-3-methyl-5-hydroxy-6-metoxy-1,4-benzoquinol methylase